jgi:hypothetical protein
VYGGIGPYTVTFQFTELQVGLSITVSFQVRAKFPSLMKDETIMGIVIL